jgi:hypothetical protein
MPANWLFCSFPFPDPPRKSLPDKQTKKIKRCPSPQNFAPSRLPKNSLGHPFSKLNELPNAVARFSKVNQSVDLRKASEKTKASPEIKLFFCPHCGGGIEVADMQCRVFRHCVLKNEGILVNPHASKEELDILLEQDLIYGCGKPFRIDQNGVPVVCEYI